jgi:hypothetical protein
LAHLARLRRAAPLPWQWDVAAVAGELADDGVGFAYPIVVLHVPRRAGKSVLALAAALDRCDLIADARCWYTCANGREVAAKLFRDEWAPMLEPLSRLYRIRKSQGSEGVHKRRGSSRLQLFAPTPTALHSTNVDTAIVDEAFAADDIDGEGIMSGITPAQLTRPWRQTWIVSAGGTITSTWLDHWLTVAEAATPGVALFDYGAPADADIADPAVWATHPAYGHTIGHAALQHEWDTRTDDAAFARSILNVWPRPSTVLATAGVDLAVWAAAARPALAPAPVTAIALDVAADRSAASIAVAGPAGAGWAVEVVDARPGVGWVAAAARDVRAAHRGAALVADSIVAASIVAELRRARLDVDAVSAGDHARACGTFVDGLGAGTITHRGQAVLDDAVTGASRRPYGDAWLWSRARSRLDISPLVAATLAVWAAHGRRTAARPAVGTANRHDGMAPGGGVRPNGAPAGVSRRYGPPGGRSGGVRG